MGSGASHNYVSSESPEVAAVRFYPSFLIKDAVVEKVDMKTAKSAWNAIIEDESPKYIELRDSGQCTATSCLTWFYDTFYHLSEQRDKDSMLLYGNGLKAQIKALVGMINMSLNLFQSDLPKITQTLQKVAKGHVVHIGVRAYQFPIVAEILLDCFKICLGDAWDEAAELAWQKVLSALLVIMLPAIIREESLLTEEQKAQLAAALQEKLEATHNFDGAKFGSSNENSVSISTVASSTVSSSVATALAPAEDITITPVENVSEPTEAHINQSSDTTDKSVQNVDNNQIEPMLSVEAASIESK